MDDQTKTKQQLIDELTEIRRRISKIEAGYPVTASFETKRIEEALRRSEERWELALNGSDLGLWDYDLETGEAFINERRAEMVGYSVDELGPHISSWGKLVHPDDIDRVTDAFNAHVRDRTPSYECEHRLRHKSGDYIWVLARGKVVELDKQGYPVRIVGTSLDITDRKRAEEALQSAHNELERRVEERTAEQRRLNERLLEEITERKQAEEALRQSQQMLSLALEGANLGIWDWDLTTGKAIWSERINRILGHTPDEFEPNIKNWKKLVHPDDWPRVSETLNLYLEGKLPEFEILYRAPNKSGEWQWLQAQGKVSEFDSDGKPIRMTGVVADVTDRKQAEQAQRESEQRLRLAWETTPDALSISRLKDGVYVEVSEGYSFLTGYEPAEILGRSALDIGFWADPADRSSFVATLEKDGHIRNFQTRFRRKDGQERATLISAGLMTLEGEPHLFAVTKDVEDLKRAEVALRESESRYRLLVERAPVGILLLDREGRIEEVNPALVELLGSPSGEATRSINILTFPNLVEAGISAAFRECMEKNRVADVEFPYNSKWGKSSYFRLVLTPRLDAYGNVSGCQAIAEDISKRKQAEEALRESEEKYRTLFEDSIDAVYMTTRAGLLVEANQAFLDLFGFSTEEARNLEIVQIYTDAADRKRFQEEIERKGSLKDYELSFRKKDGTKIEGLLTATVRLDKDGTILGYQGIIRDVTEQKKLQGQLLQAQKMEAVGTLAGGIAHDFNNLLQAILGYTEILLMKKAQEDPDRKKLEVIQHAARDGADLVSRILAFSKKSESKVRPIDLNQELRRIEELLRRTLPQMIRIDLVLSDESKIIDADPAQIEQVLLNLGVNAQHAMPDGGQLLIETCNVSISDEYLRTHLGARPGKYVLLTVSDTGLGMAPEVRERIFEPFFTTKTNAGGTGLGLSMVLGIVTQHGGYIRCYSEPGRGTSFKVYFPVSTTEALWELAETREMPAFGTETILVVDDDDRVRDMARQMIKTGGYQVLTARSGEEALEIYTARREEIALVILDLIMPGMGGKRCLEDLLRIDPDSRVIIASGLSSNGLAPHEKGSGARGFIMKPYDAKDILRAIRRVLDKGYM